ncbi:MAG: T9SS type A sorting domain-containing protein [candidate division Zixibacteria bacterium]|nr:T9SS type A sorting domain-containing protein [candidate division Zixibacteria bacterium]
MAERALDQLVEEFGDEIAVITWHIGNNDPFYLYDTQTAWARFDYYPGNYVPHGFIDGIIDGEHLYNSWRSIYLSRKEDDSPLIFTVDGNYNPVNREVNLDVDIEAVSPVDFDDLRLFCVLIENELDYHARTYNFVMRTAVPDVYGEQFDISEGETLNFLRQWNIDEELVAENSEIVLFVQDYTTREILQSYKMTVAGMTGIDDNPELPVSTALLRNYPNPFNASTNINFKLEAETDVNLSVYNIAGQKVAELVNGKMDAGEHVINWDASDMASGIYFYTLKTNNALETKRMSLVK